MIVFAEYQFYIMLSAILFKSVVSVTLFLSLVSIELATVVNDDRSYWTNVQIFLICFVQHLDRGFSCGLSVSIIDRTLRLASSSTGQTHNPLCSS